MDSRYVFAEYLRLVARFCEENIPGNQITRPAELKSFSEPFSAIPIKSVEPYFSFLQSQRSRVPIEWQVGRFISTNTEQILSYAIANSTTREEALSTAKKFETLVTNVTSITMDKQEDGSIIRRTNLYEDVPQVGQFIFDTLVALSICNLQLVDETFVIPGDRALIATRFEDLVQTISELNFSFELSYTARQYSVRLPGALVSTPIDRAESQLKSVLERELSSKLEKMPSVEDWSGKVRFYVESSLTEGVSLDDLCDHFSLSRRALSRYLKNEGTSFSQILDAIRKEKTMELIEDRSIPLKKVASAAGFNSAAHFSSSFKAWTGTTPGAFRKARGQSKDT